MPKPNGLSNERYKLIDFPQEEIAQRLINVVRPVLIIST
jgi:hypothetical protein